MVVMSIFFYLLYFRNLLKILKPYPSVNTFVTLLITNSLTSTMSNSINIQLKINKATLIFKLKTWHGTNPILR